MPASRPAPRSYWLLFAGLIHAALMLLAFPPFGFWGCTLAAPVPLIWAAWRLAGSDRPPASDSARSRLKRAIGVLAWPTVIVSAGVLPFHIYAHQWVIEVSALGYVPMVVIMSLFSGAFVWIATRVMRRWPRLPVTLVAPLAWTTMEALRGEVIATGYPWILIAHPLIDAPFAPLPAAFLGTYFVGFLVVCTSAAAVEAIWSRRYLHAADGVAFTLACVVGARALSHKPEPGPGFKIAVVQTNIPQSNKTGWEFSQRLKDFRRFLELTRLAAAGSPDLIVWPETMFPGTTLSPQAVQEEREAGLTFQVPSDSGPRREPSIQFYDQLLAASAAIGTPMLIGALGFDDLKITADPRGGVEFHQKARYNSVFLVAGGKVDPTVYSKLDLTPFGEIFPYVNHWPSLQTQILDLGANGMAFDLSPGPGPKVFTVQGKEVATAIATPVCFEATKPALCRKLVRAAGSSPVVLVNLTNDGWFGTFRPGHLQHLQVARWRCVELGVPMIRAANTGISAAIESTGRLAATGIDGVPGAWSQDGVLTATVIPARARTLYSRVGNVFGWGVLSITGALLIVSFIPRRAGAQPQ